MPREVTRKVPRERSASDADDDPDGVEGEELRCAVWLDPGLWCAGRGRRPGERE